MTTGIHPAHQKTILIAAGGTGGHVMPALALQTSLQQQSYTTLFVTDARGQAYIPQDQYLTTHVLDLPRYQGSLITNLMFAVKLITSFIQCLRLIYKNRITTIVSFGGYATLPVVLAAIFARRTIILHEQNSVLGRVNRKLGYFAHKIALSTPDIAQCSQALRHKLVITGLPLRQEITAQRRPLLTLDEPHNDRFTILITGGSQSASFFSTMVPQALQLMPFSLRQRLHLYHQCRDQDQPHTKAIYDKLEISYQIQSFFNDMPARLKAADLVLARAGASSIAEASTVGKATLFVPLPSAMDDHQTVNASFATQHGGGWQRAQKRITAPWLARFIGYLVERPQMLRYAGEQLQRYSPHHATARLTNEVIMTHINS